MTILEHSMMQITGPEGSMEFDVDPSRDKIRIIMGKEKKSFKLIDLWALVFAISGTEEQAKMMPVRQTEMVTYRGTHKIMLKKDMRKGETVVARYEMNVPVKVVEGLKGMIEQQKESMFDRGGIPIIGSKK